MFRMNKLSDYGLVLLTHFARHLDRPQQSAGDLAAETNLPLPTVGKLLKLLARGGLLVSHRGAKGGYSLARPPERISVTEIICALEGPISITECTDNSASCEYEPCCPNRPHFERINQVILEALDKVSLLELAYPVGGSVPVVETVFPLPQVADPALLEAPAR